MWGGGEGRGVVVTCYRHDGWGGGGGGVVNLV